MSKKSVMGRTDLLTTAGGEYAKLLNIQLMEGGTFQGNAGADRQTEIEMMYIRVLTEMCMTRIRWINVPEEIPMRAIELFLYRNGLALFYWDKRFNKYMMLRATPFMNINAYDEPTAFRTVGPNFPSMVVLPHKETNGAGKGIPVWCNQLRIPDQDIVRIYAKRLAILDRTIEINSMNARQNKVLKTNGRNNLSATNFNRAIELGSNYIEVDGPLGDMQFMEAVDLAIDANMIDKLHLLKVRQWNELMGLLGIGNANQDKKERLVEAEVGANDDQTLSMKSVSLQARQDACRLINEAYPDVNMWCEFNTSVLEGITMPDFAIKGLEDEGYDPTYGATFDDEPGNNGQPTPAEKESETANV